MAGLIAPADNNNQADYAREVQELDEFIKIPAGNYDGGMQAVVWGHICRETAKYNFCDFVDPRMNDKTMIDRELQEQQAALSHDILMCAPISIDKSKKDADLKSMTDALEVIQSQKKPYKKVTIPIGATGYGIGHAMAVIIEGKNAYLFEQMGGTSYQEVKKDIAQALSAKGMRIFTNGKPLSGPNKSDCASVASHILSDAMRATSIQDLMNECETKAPRYDDNAVKAQHARDKQYAAMALADINTNHRNDRNGIADIALLQKLMIKVPDISLDERRKLIEAFWTAPDKNQFINDFKAPDKSTTFNVDDQLPEPAANEAWKEEVRKAVAKANKTTDNDFEEYEDKENPNLLNFRDGQNKMVFANRNSVAVEGDLEAFREVCQVAKDLGHEQINFGKFEEHPEYRAKLFLACLEADMKMNGAPDISELRDYPEFPEIMKLYAPKQRKALQDDLKKRTIELSKANEQAANDPEVKRLKKEIADAKKAKDYDKANALQEELAQNKTNQAVTKAAHFYKEAMKASLNFYISYGSETSKPEETSKQREEKVKKHLTEYDAKEFFSKNKDGSPRPTKKEELQKYEQSQRTAKEIMGMGAPSGPRGGPRSR